MKKILFVCLGNICRSPLAHAIFSDLVKSKGLENKFFVDSCGTGSWYIGRSPDERMMALAKKKNIDMNYLRARQFKLEDFYKFDFILTMDQSNYNDVCRQALDNKYLARVELFCKYDNEISNNKDVPDPYYGGKDGFEKVFEMVERICKNLLETLVSL